MDYEQKYKKALNRAKKLLKNMKKDECFASMEDIKIIFPELKETKDELTWLKRFIKEEIDCLSSDIRDSEDRVKLKNLQRSIAWLEKQCEQEPTEMQEPKFHEGEWIVQENIGVYKVVEVCESWYEVVNNKDEHYSVGFDKEYMCHLWTIQDAKDGDVLASNSSVFMFKEEYIAEKPIAYCGIMNGRFIKGKDVCWTNQRYYPATKEQRDLLFQKMKEAGYELDADKKELKEIENKEYNGEDYGIDSLYNAQRILEKTLGKVDGYQSDDGILEHKCAITAIKKLYKQKPAWSEEDEDIKETIIAELELVKESVGEINYNGYIIAGDDKLIDWLKALKQRIGE